MMTASDGLSPQEDRLVFSATALLAVLLGLMIAVLVALCLPTWASVSITVIVVLSVAMGGGALLAKAAIAGALGVGVFWLVRRHLQRREIERDAPAVKLVAIPGATTEPQARQSRTERKAA
jgi:hypothetical protein